MNWIPSAGNLFTKGLDVDNFCHRCRKAPESTLHSVWSCSKLKTVRLSHPLFNNLTWKDHDLLIDFLFYCSNVLLPADMELLCVVLWRNWWRRNQFIHHNNVRGASFFRAGFGYFAASEMV
ncbi:hypothetical protein Q3G72_016202 [Acer saccharum]|nr:hypothetical protein Q3G72_016202 [Acer saccharum]